MSRKIIMRIGVLCAMATLTVGAARAELTLGQLRVKFESALEAEKLECGEKTLKLRDGYVGALERLKTTLGREDKLTQAAQVLAEIEKAKSEAPDWELPADADYRLEDLRRKWEREQIRLDGDHRKKVTSLVKVYLETMDERKRQLTRAGKIREALVVEEESERVRELPEVKAAMEPLEASDPGEDPGDLKKFLPGKTYSYDPEGLKSRKIRFEKNGVFIFTDDPELKANWEVKRGTRTVTLSHNRFQSPLEFEFSENGERYTGRQVTTGKARKGRLLNRGDSPGK